MSPYLRSLRNAALNRIQGADIRFFTPLDSFYGALEPYKHHRIIDAGTGTGRLPEEAQAKGFQMTGIDLLPRTGQSGKVIFCEAETFPYTEDTWLMMCRPDHGGWAYDALENALRLGAGVFYVGLERNLLLDLDGYLGRHTACWENVGEDGEHMSLFLPEALLPLDFYQNCAKSTVLQVGDG